MRIYGVYDKVLEDYIMVTLAPNDKTVIRGLRCPEGSDPKDYEIHCLGTPVVVHSLGSVSDFVKLTDQGGVDPACFRKMEDKK